MSMSTRWPAVLAVVRPLSAAAILCCAAPACRRQAAESAAESQPPATASTPHPGTPSIDFDTRAFDFGLVNEGTPLTHVFEIVNRGSAPLELPQVNTSCGCTAAVPDMSSIPPGGRSPLRVTMDTHGERGRGVRTITVSSNDPSRPTSTLEIMYDVERLLMPDRWFVQLTTTRGHDRRETIGLTGQLVGQAKLSPSVQGTELVSARTVETNANGEPGRGIELELHARKSKSPVSGEGVLTIKTGLSTLPDLSIRFGYTVD